MQWSQCCTYCWKRYLKSSMEMLSRATSDCNWTSAMSAKCLLFKSCFIRGYKKKLRARSGEEGGGEQPHFVLAKNFWMLMIVWLGALSWCKNQSPSATFLDIFVSGSHAIISTYSSKTADLLLVLEEQTPCSLSLQHQIKKSTLSWHLSELTMLFLVWANLVTSTDLTQGCSRSTNYHHLLQLCEKLRVISELFLQVMANIHMLGFFFFLSPL